MTEQDRLLVYLLVAVNGLCWVIVGAVLAWWLK